MAGFAAESDAVAPEFPTALPDARPVLSVITPMYNEAETIEGTVAALTEVLERSSRPWEVILVNDGSTDATQAKAAAICDRDPRFHVVTHPANRGRGAGLRTGFARARGDFLVTIEADLSYDPALLLTMIQALETEGGLHIALASPYMRGGSTAGVPPARLAISRLGNWVLNLVMSGDFRTVTQMFRAYKREVIAALDLESDGKEIHLEILSKALALGFHAREFPAQLRGRAGGTSKFRLVRTVRSHLMFSYLEKPMLLFGLLGVAFLVVAAGIGLVLLSAYLRGALNPTRPFMTVLVVAVIAGLQFLSLGLIGTQIVGLRKEVYRVQMENRRLEAQLEARRR